MTDNYQISELHVLLVSSGVPSRNACIWRESADSGFYLVQKVVWLINSKSSQVFSARYAAGNLLQHVSEFRDGHRILFPFSVSV